MKTNNICVFNICRLMNPLVKFSFTKILLCIVISIIFFPKAINAQTKKVLVFVSHENTYYSEYIVLTKALEARGYNVEVRSATTLVSSIYMTPYADIPAAANDLANSSYAQFTNQFQGLFGSAWNASWNAIPTSVTVSGSILDVQDMSSYDALIVVGGLGAQDYRVDGTYASQGAGARLISASLVQQVAEKLNTLAINALVSGKPVMAQCHGASLPVYWRIPGTSGSGAESLGFSLLKNGFATGFPEPETATSLSSLFVNLKPEDKVVVSSPHSSLNDNGNGDFRIVTTRDWYPQTVAHATKTIINIMESYFPVAEMESQTHNVLVIHGGLVNNPNCTIGFRASNDIPCNFGTTNLPADFSDLQSLFNANSSVDGFNFSITGLNLAGTLPYSNTINSMLSYFDQFDAIIFYKHWTTNMNDNLQNALVTYTGNGGGLLFIHHGIYNDFDNATSQTKNILVNIAGAESNYNDWNGSGIYNYNVVSSNYGHFISTYGINYNLSLSTPSSWTSAPLSTIANRSLSRYPSFGITDELYHNLRFLTNSVFGEGNNQITPILSNDVSTLTGGLVPTGGVIHSSGFVKRFNNGRIAVFQIGERKNNYSVNSNYGQILRNAAVWVSNKATAKLSQSISNFPVLNTSYTLLQSPISFSNATSTSGLPVSVQSSQPNVVSIVGTNLVFISSGTTTITASQLGNGVYNQATPLVYVVTVSRANQTISGFPNLASSYLMTQSGISFAGASASSGLPISVVSANQNIISVVGTTLNFVGAGTTTITASQLGNGVYNSSLPIVNVVTVNKLQQSIVFPDIESILITTPSFIILATSTSGLPVTFTLKNIFSPSYDTIVGNSFFTSTFSGIRTIVASQPGNQIYEAATSVEKSFTINKLTSFIANFPFTKNTYTYTDFPISIANVSCTSGMPIYFFPTNDALSFDGFNFHFVNEGESYISASSNANELFEGSFQESFLDIKKANQTIVGFPNLNSAYSLQSEKIPFSTASTTSGLIVEVTSSNPNVVSVVGTDLIFTGLGSTTISISQSGNQFYNSAIPMEYVVSVVNTKISQTISFPSISDVLNTTASINLEAESSSGLPVSFSLISGPATLVGSVLYLSTTTGLVEIEANQEGNDVFLPANPVFQSFSIMADTILTSNYMFKEASEIQIYPNPNLGQFKIESEHYEIDAVELIDVLGKRELVKETNHMYSTYLKGLVIVRIRSKNSVFIKKIFTK